MRAELSGAVTYFLKIFPDVAGAIRPTRMFVCGGKWYPVESIPDTRAWYARKTESLGSPKTPDAF